MISFFKTVQKTVIAVKSIDLLSKTDYESLKWLFGNAELISDKENLSKELFIGPRREMITPWSTTAVEITQNMNINGVIRIEEFFPVQKDGEQEPQYDKMLQRLYKGLDDDIFTIDRKPEDIVYIKDLENYNEKEGLALNSDEIEYLNRLSKKLNRPLTDSEVFGFSQVNSEHCRHKIFNGIFIIDGKEKESSLFKMIKRTSTENPNLIVSAYKDNCAFLEGPKIKMFHPKNGTKPDFFVTEEEQTVISLKAETHNFPTTVEPFNGAATGTGGEIRDRMAGGKGSFPIAGTAVYMTSYPRFDSKVEATDKSKEVKIDELIRDFQDKNCINALKSKRKWESGEPREWLYQSPQEILTKASNGASDFGNKFGQCIICGSLYTFEYDGRKEKEKNKGKFAKKYDTPVFGYDKVIMLAGGIGYAKKTDALKDTPGIRDKVVVLGGDNYRIGMGGGAVSSVNTGQYANAIELNAIQRSNPEMQKRVYNAIRSLAESENNTIISVHDHGAGGHLNCLSELVEETGGNIDISKLPVGDPTLSLKEIIGNESQERMGLVIKEADINELKAIAERERAPMYIVGETTGLHNFTLKNEKTGEAAIDLAMNDMFGSAPKTVMTDITNEYKFDEIDFSSGSSEFISHLEQVLQIESVACKDWLTNKVDRSVNGLIAGQQTTGEVQLPLNNLGVTAIGYDNKEGIATSLGHAPAVALIDSGAGSRISISEALTNVVWAPLKNGLKGVSLSANWMWPSRNTGEDARLYKAVEAASDFAVKLGINIPTGKDSMSMTQKYPDGEKVLAPGTLIISTVAPVIDINNIVRPNAKRRERSEFIYIPFVNVQDKNIERRYKFALGGSAFAQTINQMGNITPDIVCPDYFVKCFDAVQNMVIDRLLLAGHDISSGGMITTLLEMCFANVNGGIKIDLSNLLKDFNEASATLSENHSKNNHYYTENQQINDIEKILFSEQPGVIVQVAEDRIAEVYDIMSQHNLNYYKIGEYSFERSIDITATWNSTAINNFATDSGKEHTSVKIALDIDSLRDIWFKTSYLFDIRQIGEKCARDRFQNYKHQPLKFKFPETFTGLLSNYDSANYKQPIAAIIREKGSNGDREMAWALNLAGFRVKDVHMTDLVSGRETLEDIQMIVFVGGFSNADTLGSAKGWAGAFLYNQKAKAALDKFYARKDTMSLGVCNGCQLMAELGLITPEKREVSPKMIHNDSHKYESAFVGVEINDSSSIMLKSLAGSQLGIWVAHGEGKFSFPYQIEHDNLQIISSEEIPLFKDFQVALRYSYNAYPANPNGSPAGIAGVCSNDGRHLAMMPHPERGLRPWNWAYYPEYEKDSSFAGSQSTCKTEITPWVEMFINARKWLAK